MHLRCIFGMLIIGTTVGFQYAHPEGTFVQHWALPLMRNLVPVISLSRLEEHVRIRAMSINVRNMVVKITSSGDFGSGRSAHNQIARQVA